MLAAFQRGQATSEELAGSAPRLVDSRHRAALEAAIEKIPLPQLESRSGLAYAAGCLSLASGDEAEAMRLFAHAQATLEPSSRGLAARIAFEVGFVHLANSRSVTSEALLAWAEGMYSDGASNADLLHLRAIAAEHMGDHVGARNLYRAVLQSSAEALTPMTRALAMVNLAVSMNHIDPKESLALTHLAATLVDAEELDTRVQPALWNIQAYALICLARLHDARVAAAQAVDQARALGHRRVELYALFNRSIIDELEGALDRARGGLERVRRDSAASDLPDLEGWAVLRLAWLDVRAGQPAQARSVLDEATAQLASMRYSESLKTMSGLINFGLGRLAGARMDLESALRSARQREDLLTQLALLLWLGFLEGRVGRNSAATRVTARAMEIARTHGLRLSPNWWTSEVVGAAQARTTDQASAELLYVPRSGERSVAELRAVRITRSGGISIDGQPLPAGAWRVGRTGSGVLQRFFARLALEYPSAVARDDLSQHLWPESDGDRATRNLYSATVDLRRLLADVPGVAVSAEAGVYAIRCDTNVEVSP